MAIVTILELGDRHASFCEAGFSVGGEQDTPTAKRRWRETFSWSSGMKEDKWDWDKKLLGKDSCSSVNGLFLTAMYRIHECRTFSL